MVRSIVGTLVEVGLGPAAARRRAGHPRRPGPPGRRPAGPAPRPVPVARPLLIPLDPPTPFLSELATDEGGRSDENGGCEVGDWWPACAFGAATGRTLRWQATARPFTSPTSRPRSSIATGDRVDHGGARGRRLVRPAGGRDHRRRPGRGARPQPGRGEGARGDDARVAPAPRPRLDQHLRTYLFVDGDILEVEEAAEHGGDDRRPPAAAWRIGSLRNDSEDSL